MYFSVQMKLNDVEGAYHCPLCNKPSVQNVVGCDNFMEWYPVPNQGTKVKNVVLWLL